jgi:outer membrane protein assembly factor BamB
MRALRLAVVAPALLAAACSSYNPLVWVGIMSTPANPPTPLTPIEAKVTPRAVWTASVGKSKGYNLRPAIEQGKVYAAAADGTITVVAEDTGKQVARFETKKPISGGLEVADGRVFAGTLKGEVIALDAAGKSLWSTHLAGEVIAPASVSRNAVVVRTSDGRIFAYSVAEGKRLWVYQRPTPSLLLRSPAGVLAVAGDVVAGYPNGKLVALDLDDGKLTWEATVALPKGSTELERIADVAGLPVIDGSNVCAGAFQGKIACFEIATRNMVWSRDISTARGLTTDAKNLYVVDDTGAVLALDKRSGASVWKQDKLRYRQLTSPVVFDGHVVVADGYGYIHVLSADDGALIGRLATDKSVVESLVPGLSALFAQTAGGELVAVRF